MTQQEMFPGRVEAPPINRPNKRNVDELFKIARGNDARANHAKSKAYAWANGRHKTCSERVSYWQEELRQVDIGTPEWQYIRARYDEWKSNLGQADTYLAEAKELLAQAFD